MNQEKNYSYEEVKAEIAELKKLESPSETDRALLSVLEQWVLHFDQSHRLQ